MAATAGATTFTNLYYKRVRAGSICARMSAMIRIC